MEEDAEYAGDDEDLFQMRMVQVVGGEEKLCGLKKEGLQVVYVIR